MARTRIAITLLISLSLIAAACGDDDGAATTEAAPTTTTTAAPTTTTTAAPTTTTTAAPTTTTTTAVAVELPPTGVIGVVDASYKWGDEQGEADPEDLPFPLGEIEAHWYQAGDFYAVVYAGLDLDETGPLCPGNSILGDNGPLHITNSPTPGGDCGGVASIAEPPAGVQVCDGVVFYLTEIPNGTLGWLYASLEYYTGTGTNYGATAIVQADPDYMAEIDPATLGC